MGCRRGAAGAGDSGTGRCRGRPRRRANGGARTGQECQVGRARVILLCASSSARHLAIRKTNGRAPTMTPTRMSQVMCSCDTASQHWIHSFLSVLGPSHIPHLATRAIENWHALIFGGVKESWCSQARYVQVDQGAAATIPDRSDKQFMFLLSLSAVLPYHDHGATDFTSRRPRFGT